MLLYLVKKIILKFQKNRLSEINSKKAKTKTEEPVEKKKISSGFFFKFHLRKLFPFYYNMRYLNIFFLPKPGEIYNNSFKRFALPRTILNFEDSKFEELFELASKAIFLGTSMLEIDIAEINSVDNFKENYSFTVNFE